MISKRVTVEEPTHAEMERKEKQKNEMQRALLEQIEAKKRQKEEEERRRKQEELEEEMRIRRENEEIEKKLEAERQQQKKKAQLFDSNAPLQMSLANLIQHRPQPRACGCVKGEAKSK